ncbi:hydroxylamine reductase [Megasphaera vaginalis (ex Srinivasan et al. 2021)]|uniref:Hydroxylamine reductase n=1 Tax=Megasphaera vaginalis (ex Srinivasan et al. 2021) TaxID=1111454 RepID=U7UVL7_9FIRM|nr:hydroxylamine reductase [Megasphaera vaginalis (ex Srinivasan et al. 2021)]ERT62513.1 hydroxylamine reductase [Megasphaera vaginalis (ex Srinivasan et al. 2021)]
MDQKMFCFQCEQTMGGTGCTGGAGVCGKSSAAANLQDELTGALIGLARTCQSVPATAHTYRVILEGLFTTITNVDFNVDTIQAMTDKVNAEKAALIAGNEGAFDKVRKLFGGSSAADKAAANYNIQQVWSGNEDVRSLKSLILFGMRGMAAYAYHALMLGHSSDEVNQFFVKGLHALGEDWGMDELLPIVLETGKANFACMEMLDRANTTTYGTPTPTTVPLTIEKGPFIVVTGHDLKDLELLLKQTEGKGVNIYTHGEMLPAHGYPELKKYKHLKGNFGTAWQNQQKEFDNVPAAFLFTTNCLMPPRKSYSDRVFTTEVVSFPGLVHIDDNKDFTPVINKALELGGYAEDHEMTGINGGKTVMTGFGHGTVLGVADKVIDAVKAGAIKHFFLVGGCDGARPGRNYYTEFVQKAPQDSVILTLACGKYRFNDLDLGTIGGLPRIMDMGQCNDAFSAIKVALALAEAFECGVNELPLSLVLSWYEQKAVCILLTLLYLGIKNIYLGPTLPAFVSPNVLNYLVENYNISPLSTPEEDLKKILG